MPHSVRVHLSPASLSLQDLSGSLAIVIDLIRASTTIVHALAAGASSVAPCESIESAQALAATYPRNSFLLGGERRGIRIDGFDLGNSPTEYTSAKVRNKTIIFTTTNGTIALHRAQSAQRILIGCFANLSAVTNAAHESNLPIHLICAGIHGQPCCEDTLCAGAMAAILNSQSHPFRDPDTLGAINLWNSIPRDQLASALRTTEGGQNLIAVGLDNDISATAEIDSHPLIPEWDAATRTLRSTSRNS